jgi:hypothetical protein
VSLSLPEGTAEAIRARVGKREFSAFIAEAVERELRGQVLDEYLADYESRKGPVSEQARQRARQVFDAAIAEAALRQHRPVVMLTSEIDDMVKLCGDRVRLIAV